MATRLEHGDGQLGRTRRHSHHVQLKTRWPRAQANGVLVIQRFGWPREDEMRLQPRVHTRSPQPGTQRCTRARHPLLPLSAQLHQPGSARQRKEEWYGWTKGRIRKGETTEPHEPMHMRGQVVAHWQLCLSRLLPATVAGHSIACAVCGVAPSLLHPLAEL